MTVRELITELLNYDLDKYIKVGTDKPYQAKDGYMVVGCSFDIKHTKQFANCIDIIFDDWRYNDD